MKKLFDLLVDHYNITQQITMYSIIISIYSGCLLFIGTYKTYT